MTNGEGGAGGGGGRTLTLKSPVGKEAMVYSWPLKKGRGSLRRSEDKQDEAAEIIETIRWVCEDCNDIKQSMDSSGLLAASRYDPTSYDSMNAICSAYNRAVDKLVSKERGTSKQERRCQARVTRPHLKHILQKCYNKSVIDPNELNNYEAFTPEVYGETSFELICQILDKLNPIGSENKFVDLGSGVGQVVLQVAALTDCQMSLGIEKAATPARYANDMKKWFEFWMDFYGKVYSKYRLVTGDFLESSHRPEILGSTIVFVNNFAFGPEVDQHLKDVFADLPDGARIFSSKSFCALNFRITDRNLSDIGTIMHVSKMDPLKGSVSWTGKPVSYYLHVIDRAKLERYFQKSRSSSRKDDGRGGVGRRGRHGFHHGPGSHHDHLGIDESSSGSPEDSRASSVEKEVNSLSLSEQSSSMPQTPNQKSSKYNGAGSDDESPASSPGGAGGGGTTPSSLGTRRKKMVGGKSGKKVSATAAASVKINSSRRLGSKKRLGGSSGSFDDLIESGEGGGGEVVSTPTDSSSSTPPPPPPPSSLASAGGGDSNSSSSQQQQRPVRAAVANAAAISEAAAGDDPRPVAKKRGRKPNLELKKKGLKNRGGIGSGRGVGSGSGGGSGGAHQIPIKAKMSGLDLLQKTMMDSIQMSASDVSAPQGCVNERLTKSAPKELVHEELPLSMNLADDGVQQLPFQLQLHLERCKRQYLSFMKHMQDPVFKARVEADLEREKKRNQELVKREKQLKAQIENLITDSLQLLKCRLNELGIQAKSPPEFIEKAKGIVRNHHKLQENKSGLEREIQALELEQENIIAAKEKELYDTMIKTGVSTSEARQIVRKQIDNAVNGLAALAAGKIPPGEQRVNPLLNKLSDVTLTKCPAPPPPAAAVTAAPAAAAAAASTATPGGDNAQQQPPLVPSSTQIRKRPRDKQKDWPEKRHKPVVSKDGSFFIEPKIEEKNPEILAKKIIEQGRSLEKSKVSGGLSIAPSPVEVRKLEVPPSTRQSVAPPQQQQPSLPPGAPASQQHRGGVVLTASPALHPPPPPPPPPASMQPPAAPPSSTSALPKIDLSLALSNAGGGGGRPPPMDCGPGASSSSGVRPPSMEPPLVLPPHPDSRSRSSEGQTAEDMSFASTKVNSTPRAEQFEDGLKTIIHSVLTGDGDQQQQQQAVDVKPPLQVGVPPRSPTPSSSKPMFSPVKKELPTNLPLPPSGVVEHRPSYPGAMTPPTPAHSKPAPMKRPSGGGGGGGPPPGSNLPPGSNASYYHHRHQQQQQPRLGDIISSEVEKEMRMQDEYNRMGNTGNLPPAHQMQPKPAHSSSVITSGLPPGGPAHRNSSSSGGGADNAAGGGSGMSRMSQVIEDSIRGHIEAASRSEQPQPPPPQSKKMPRSLSGERGSDPHGHPHPEDFRNAMNGAGMGDEYGRYSAGMDRRAGPPHDPVYPGGPQQRPLPPPRRGGYPVESGPWGHPSHHPPMPPPEAHGGGGGHDSRGPPYPPPPGPQRYATYPPGAASAAHHGGGGGGPPPSHLPPSQHMSHLSPRKRMAHSPPPPPMHGSGGSMHLPPKKQHGMGAASVPGGGGGGDPADYRRRGE